MDFQSFNFTSLINRALDKLGYVTPTTIQKQVIPKILEGKDIRGSAPTGTGKTAAFLLPAIHQLLETPDAEGKGPRLLVLVPTRELGMQIAIQAEKYSKYSPLRTVCIAGGVPYHKQLPKLRRPYDILVATPGRLIDLLDQKKIILSRINLLVLDEADMMLDMGFVPSVKKILTKIPATKQTLLFSATFDPRVKKLSAQILNDPIDVIVKRPVQQNPIEQELYYTKSLLQKNSLLEHYLQQESMQNAVIFTATKMHADRLASTLVDQGYKAKALHGDMPQRKRTRTIENMRKGDIAILVATDVASRGIDIDSITHVINFDLPRTPEDYVHRIGRTGRAGATGKALSFALYKEKGLIRKIEQLTQQPFTVNTPPKDIIPHEGKLDNRNARPRNAKHKRTFSKRPDFSKKGRKPSSRSFKRGR